MTSDERRAARIAAKRSQQVYDLMIEAAAAVEKAKGQFADVVLIGLNLTADIETTYQETP